MPRKNLEEDQNSENTRLADMYDQLRTTIFTTVRRRNKEDTIFLVFLGVALLSVAIAFIYFFLSRLEL